MNKPPAALPGDGLLPLEAILCTEELNRRPVRPADYETENRALASLAQALADSPLTFLQRLSETILDVFHADSAGISLLTEDRTRFYWPAIAGMWQPHTGGGTPRDFGPCGDVLDRNTPLLFRHFERRYTYLEPVMPPAEEGLLVPIYVEGKAVGTIWAITHDGRRKFDNEDLRQLVSLGSVASSGCRALALLGSLEHSHTELAQRDAALQSANAAAPARRAALNLMEDAVQSREAAERLNVELRESELRFREMIEALPAAVYTTDAEGRITHFNSAAREFSGRTPELHKDQWCVSWKLFRPDGTPLPHEECPMAVALREGREIRGEELIAERPDGTRRWLAPYPTPLRDAEGRVIGGINMLVDITDRKHAEEVMAHLAAIVTTSDDAIISASLQGTIRSWNQGAQRLFGYTEEEAIGKPTTLLIPPDRVDEEPEILERIRRGEAVDHYQTVRQRKDGSRLDVSLAVSPLRDAAGRIVGATKIARDITEGKRAEDERRKTEERMRFALDSMPQKIFTAKPNGDVDYFNPQWAEFTGLSFEQIKDWGWVQFIHSEDVAENVRVWRHSIDTGQRFQFEHRFRLADGEYRWHLSRAVPLRDAEGKIVMWVGSSTDVHEQRDTETKLREFAAELSAADRHKNEFLAMLAHELRNPLAPIHNALEIVRMSGIGGEAARSAFAMMERQVAQMTRLVDDLVDVSRISRGKIELRRERIELTSVVNHAAEAIGSLCQSMNHDLAVTLPSQPIYLNADRARLVQVVGNLLHNACKFTNRGGRIGLTVERDGEQAVIRVRDSGIGIAPHQLPRIFDMFMQGDTSLERSAGGLGIGLTLVKSMVEIHGGTVETHSAGVGRGTEFVVRLPMAEARKPLPAEPAAGEPGAATPRRILVVDDNQDSATSLAMLLKLAGHETHIAHDGLEAVEAAAAFRPEVVLLDIGLPKLNGYGVAQEIRRQPWGESVVLVAMSGWSQDEARLKSSAAGFSGHMVKPVDHAALTKLLAALPSGGSSG